MDSNRRPDDKVYNAHEYLRKNVARGNSVLYIHNLETNEVQYDGVIFALRKFTGEIGDDDDDIPDSNTVWQKYFTQKVNSAVKIVCTEKANGEAAHLSARFINDQFYLILGKTFFFAIDSSFSVVSRSICYKSYKIAYGKMFLFSTVKVFPE